MKLTYPLNSVKSKPETQIFHLESWLHKQTSISLKLRTIFMKKFEKFYKHF